MENKTLIEKIADSFDKNQNNTAVEEEGDSYSYKELWEQVLFTSNLINRKQFKKIAVMGEPSFITAASLLSALMSRAVYVPLDPSWPLNRINSILKHCRAEALISSSLDFKKYSLNEKEIHAPYVFLMQKIGRQSRLESPVRNTKSNDSLAYIMYTSGSSGEPKGVEVKLKALDKFLTWVEEEFQITEGDRFSYTSSLGFGSSIRQVFSPILSGAKMVCFPQSLLKSPHKLLEEIKDKKISLFNAPPVLLQKTAEAAQKNHLDKNFLSNVRLILAGGDLFPKKIKELWFNQFQHEHQLVNLYGSTESIVNASAYSMTYKKSKEPALDALRGEGLREEKSAYEYLPIGRPREGLKFFLLDKDQKKITTENQIGELCIKSAFLAQSYHNNKQESEKTFQLSNDCSEYIYRSGDRALKLPDGSYLVLGRSDRQVQIYGQRVELGEIESHLNRHPQTTRAFVVYIEEEGLNKICAFIQSKNYNEKQLREFLKKQVPSYMIPHFFYKLEKPPLTAAGKLDYKALRETALRKLLNEGRGGLDSKEKNSRFLRNDRGGGSDGWLKISGLEDEIKELWMKRLNKKDVSKTENFFDAGGDSILAVSLYQDLCDKFDLFLDPYIFYHAPNIKNIAMAVQKAQEEKLSRSLGVPVKAQAEAKSLSKPSKRKNLNRSFFNLKNFFQSGVRAEQTKEKTKPLSFKLVFLGLLLKTMRSFYKLQALFYRKNYLKKELQSPQQKHFVWTKRVFNELYNGFFSVPISYETFDKEELKRALRLVIQYQESLRTVFVGEEQAVLPELPLELIVYNLKAQSLEERKKSLFQIESQMLNHSFSISKLPLFKISLLELSKEKAHLIFCINHLIGDGWSLQAFLSFLNDCYAFLRKERKTPPLHSYIDYTKQYKAFCRKVFFENKSYWDKKISEYSAYNLSEKFKNQNKKSPEENTEESAILQTGHFEKIKTFCRDKKLLQFDLLLFLWLKSLREFLGCDKLCFFTTYHGRDFPFKNIQSLIGSLARLAPVFIDTDFKNIETALPLIKESYLQSLKHKDFNMFKTLFSRQSDFKNNIGFNYLDFQNLSHLTKGLPFTMDWSSAKVQLSSNRKNYNQVYLFFSIHSYLSHIELKLYGRCENKKELIQIMKKNIEALK